MEEEVLSIPRLQIDQAAQTSLRETTRWTNFIAIMTYVLMGLILLALVFMFQYKGAFINVIKKAPEMSQFSDALGLVVVALAFVIIIGLGIFGIINYILLRFSNQTRTGVDQQDQIALERGISSLKVYLIIIGGFSILGIIVSLTQFIIIL
ncbi:MAG: hypothetical protein ABI581_11305 [Sediminibacterium sp.]